MSPNTGVGEYVSDGTIDPPVIGEGGGVSPSEVDEYASSPAGRREDLPRATEEEYRMDDEEEEEVMGLLFAANACDEDFVPPSGIGKGKGKSRAVAMDGVLDAPEDVSASSSTRVQRKRQPNSFPIEAETEHRDKDDDDHESDEADPRTRAISAPALLLLYARPKKRRRDDDDGIVVVLLPLQVQHALAQNVLYSDRCVGRRRVPQRILRRLHRETDRPSHPVPQNFFLLTEINGRAGIRS